MPVATDKVLVVGELNPDLIISGLGGFPALSQEITGSELHTLLGGSSAICAAGLARFGVPVDLLGMVGSDHYGDFVADELLRLGVGVERVIRNPALATGLTVVLAYPRERAMVTVPGAMAALCREDIPTSVLAGYCHLHVSSYFLQRGLQPGLGDLFDAAHRVGLTTSLDPGWDPDEGWGGSALLAVLERTDIFLPNEAECCAIARAAEVGDAACELARLSRLVVVKRGPQGALAAFPGGAISAPGFQVIPVDTTGAGDSFDAGFLYAHAVRRFDLKEALRFANACGALSTTGFGGTAAQPTLEQVLRTLGR